MDMVKFRFIFILCYFLVSTVISALAYLVGLISLTFFAKMNYGGIVLQGNKLPLKVFGSSDAVDPSEKIHLVPYVLKSFRVLLEERLELLNRSLTPKDAPFKVTLREVIEFLQKNADVESRLEQAGYIIEPADIFDAVLVICYEKSMLLGHNPEPWPTWITGRFISYVLDSSFFCSAQVVETEQTLSYFFGGDISTIVDMLHMLGV